MESTLLLPILLLVLFGIAQWAILMNTLATVNHAATTGARLGAAIGTGVERTLSGDVNTDIRNAVKTEQGILSIADTAITIEPAVGLRTSGAILTVTVTYGQPVFAPAIAQLTGDVYTATGRSVVRVE